MGLLRHLTTLVTAVLWSWGREQATGLQEWESWGSCC